MVLLAGLFYLFIFCQAAYAEKITASVINVAPLGFTEAEKQTGLYVEILQSLASAGGFEVDIRLTPYLRAISLVESKEIDLTIMFDTEISEKIKTKKVTLYERNLNVYTLNDHAFSSLQFIVGEIGRLNGACSDLEKKSKIKLVNLGSFDQGLNLLLKERLQGICGSHAAIYYACHKMKIPIGQFQGVLVARKTLSVHFHPDTSDKKIKKFKDALLIINKNGELQKIRNKYHDTET